MQPDLTINWGLEVWYGLYDGPEWWEYEEDDSDDDHVYVYTRRTKLRPLVIRKNSREI